MPRRRGAQTLTQPARWDLTLMCGLFVRPLREMGDDAAVEFLREVWEVRRDRMLEVWRQDRPGERPWAWWTFDAGERRPFSTGNGADVAIRRLVELGVVDAVELRDLERVTARRVRALTGADVGLGEG